MTKGMEHPFILGSAGHIDHGKTSLVRALTGVDCDRLSEEKKRGITIELGFAPLSLPSGRVVSIVDVPGHEKFIRQMVAGAAGIDAAMLVVAADEGVMPQTREHLDILKLLGVSRGLVVLNKIDLADDEMRELASFDVEKLVRGTFLEGAPVLLVSSLNGEGIPALLAALEKIVADTPVRDCTGAFFMPIDRAFGMRGFGSVVTGTAYCGVVREGDDVTIMPSGLTTKVRSLQVHGAPSQTASAGQRTAINLASVSLEQLHRGDVVCEPGRFFASECLDARLDVLPSAPEPIRHWQRLRLHIGTTDAIIRVSLLGGLNDGMSAEHSKRADRAKILPGESGLVQLLPESPIAAAAGEGFVVRFYSPLRTIGGGEILLPGTSRPRSREERATRENILRELNAAPREALSPARLVALIREKGAIEENQLFKLSQMSQGDFNKTLKRLRKDGDGGKVLSFGESRRIFCSDAICAAILVKIQALLQAFHQKHPELGGLAVRELTQATRVAGADAFEQKDLNELLKFFTARGDLKSVEANGELRFHLPEFQPRNDDRFIQMVKKLNEFTISKGFQLAELESASKETGIPPAEMKKALGYLKENADFKIIGEGLLLPRETKLKLTEILASIEGDLTVASLRDAIGTSRKYALAILEFFDSQGVTRRVGDKRVLLKIHG